MNQPLVSLILITYQSVELLPAFFTALATTTYQPYEVIVVDNNSTDGTSEWLWANQPTVRLIANHDNRGFGRACNQGAAVAHGAFFVFLNPDILVLPDWLDRLMINLQANPQAAISCPQTVEPGQPLPDPNQQPVVAKTAAVPGCALVLRRTAWEQIGGFDEQIFLYWEDTELCWRAWVLGWQVLEDRQAAVFHERGGSGGGASGWDAERAHNSLYTYLKLRRWRHIFSFGLRLALNSIIKAALGRPGLRQAWVRIWHNLGYTLAQRRAIQRRQRGDSRQLDALIAAHEQRQRHERALRKQQATNNQNLP
jgi:GT2 family glycosyltransferase